MGITLDPHETDPSKKFKLFGSGIIAGKKTSGIASSPDGIHWSEPESLTFPHVVAAPNAGKVGAQRYDCHQQPLWDEEEQSYVLTTRTYPGSRAIGLLRASSWDGLKGAVPETLVQVEVGDADHQLYSQITFRFYDIWLGMVMVFDGKRRGCLFFVLFRNLKRKLCTQLGRRARQRWARSTRGSLGRPTATTAGTGWTRAASQAPYSYRSGRRARSTRTSSSPQTRP